MQEIDRKVSELTGFPKDLVSKTYKAYWRFIKDKVENLPLKEKLSREEFSNLKTNFNLPYLGKLFCNYDRWVSIRNKYNNGIKYKKD